MTETLQMRCPCLHMCMCICAYPPHSPATDTQRELVCSSSQTLTHSQSNVLIRDCTVHTELIAMTQDVDTHTHTRYCKNCFFFNAAVENKVI